MDDLLNEVLGKVNESGFKQHPLGSFNAEVVDVVERVNRDGKTIFDISLRTARGTARKDIWLKTSADIDGEFLEVAQGDHEKARAYYVNHLSNVGRLYKDLGIDLGAFQTIAEAEAAYYGNLGALIGCQCIIVVRESKDPQYRTIFINAPKEGHEDREQGAPLLNRGRSTNQRPQQQSNQFSNGNLADVPF
jgi:hypothetical protein